MAAAKTTWIVLHSGMARNVPRLDGKGKPVVMRGRPVIDQVSIPPNEPHEFVEREARKLMDRGYARRARKADFEDLDLPVEFSK